ncbi:MAG: hypothetical protein J3Q66DRAFT_409376 [Benniella sp.]|nr:MAG: hypothetical protein J3Q66DRAFT_409376 [Benniella sp.]
MKVSAAIFSCLSSLYLPSLAHGFVYPATPVGATIWKPNTEVTISWSDDKQPPLLSSKPVFDIFLMTGADDNQVKLATIATDVSGDATQSVKYQVPYVSPPGQIYFLMFQTKDTKYTAWATRFTITDASGNPGSLRPTIPPGGKINSGGLGSIVAAPSKDQQSKTVQKKQNSKNSQPKEAALGTDSAPPTQPRSPDAASPSTSLGANGALKATEATAHDDHADPASSKNLDTNQNNKSNNSTQSKTARSGTARINPMMVTVAVAILGSSVFTIIL